MRSSAPCVGDVRERVEVRERAGVSARETHGRKCAVSALGVEEKTFRAHWGARRERVRRRNALVWRRRRSGRAGVRAGNAGRQTRKELSGVARRSSNAQRIAGLSQCVGCGVIQKEECKHLWDRKVCPSVLGVGWSVKARWTLTMGTFIVSHAGWSTTQRRRDYGKTPRTFNWHATFRV